MWTAVWLAAIVCVGLKLIGYATPSHWLEAERPARIADLLTVALLAALVAVQTLAAGQSLVVDARLPAVLVAAVMLWMRAPFLAVVVVGAVVAAVLRGFGLAA